MESEAQILLTDVVAFCQRDGQDARLTNMLGRSRPLDMTESALIVEAPTRFAVAFLERNKAIVEHYLEEIAFMHLDLVVQPPAAAFAPDAARAAAAPSAPVAQAAAPTAEGRDMEAATATDPMGAQPMAGGAAIPAAAPVAAASASSAATPVETHVPANAVVPGPAPAAPVAAPAAAPAPTAAQGLPGAAIAAVPIAREKNPGAVSVTNTMSRDDFLKMLQAQKGGASTNAPAPSTGAATAPGVAVAPAGTETHTAEDSAPAGSKFTFANFVYGDENKHAYHSAQRFAAFVDEPGQYNSLFIYGGSGLGKTHLLLAIKNYLAETKPHIRVKYANSQAYIDDFINEIARQKTEGRAILREYHEANVLIIDDIQNIIGKQASIEYFFSLMDEFIRENKKIVIASDRAPKNLGMDERLTSRFNAGMLCLVSEPGFEMKYTILKRYYEGTIKPQANMSPANVDASLLDAFRVQGGDLTDEQLRYMAEISGNNIRELESFCERCASLSFEREQQGRELDAVDIEKVADEYFDTVHKVIHIDEVQAAVEEFYQVSHEDLIGPKRSKGIAFARHVAVYLANSLCELSSSAIGAQFGGRDHSTVLNSLKVVESKMQKDRRICEDLQQLKSMIAQRS